MLWFLVITFSLGENFDGLLVLVMIQDKDTDLLHFSRRWEPDTVPLIQLNLFNERMNKLTINTSKLPQQHSMNTATPALYHKYCKILLNVTLQPCKIKVLVFSVV